MKARMPSQPAANPRGFVCAVVVQDEVGLEAGGHRHLGPVRELAELDGPMATMALPNRVPLLTLRAADSEVVPWRA